MTPLRLVAFAALATALAGCGEDGGGGGAVSTETAPALPSSGPPGARFPEASQRESMPVRPRIIPSEGADNIVLDYRGGSGGGATIRRPPGTPTGHRISDDEAMQAARDANRVTGTSEPCNLAYQALEGMGQEVATKTPGLDRNPIDRDDFMERCEDKSDREQWCMVPSYLASHSDECDEVAHTRYARAIERFEARDTSGIGVIPPDPDAPSDTEDDDAEVDSEGGAGPTRLGPPRTEAPCTDGNCDD